MRHSKKLSGLLVLSLACAVAQSAPRPTNQAAGVPHLGDVHFANSCSSSVQNSFNVAVALLHSFQYQEAESAFTQVGKQDPRCAMAWWGKAMSLYQQLWDFPNAARLKRGREYIRKAQQLGAKTQRERDYIAAAAAFYQDNPRLDQNARTEAYSKAMESLYSRHPEDVNAGAFYALSLVALAQDGVQDMANRKRAIAILDKLFAKHPNNPGVDHYLIHASDSPALARYGLAAARNYAKIAPDSAHALHMPSHIFTRLGLWQESIKSNLASAAAAEKATESRRDNEWTYQIHALTFLEYAYLESGHDADARRVIDEVKNVPGDSAQDLRENQTFFRTTLLHETHQWKKAAGLALPAGDLYPGDRIEVYWTRAVGAARSGDAAAARKDFGELKEAEIASRSEMKGRGLKPSSGESVGDLEAEAWIEQAEGKHDRAVKTMRAAVNKEGPNGVDILGMPAQEMLGDLLLELHQPGEALSAYQAALKESPNRFDSLYGAGRAAELAGSVDKARSYYGMLLKICGPDADREEVQQARVQLVSK